MVNLAAAMTNLLRVSFHRDHAVSSQRVYSPRTHIQSPELQIALHGRESSLWMDATECSPQCFEHLMTAVAARSVFVVDAIDGVIQVFLELACSQGPFSPIAIKATEKVVSQV